MLFFKGVIIYILLLVGYIAYLVSQVTTDHLHAAGLFVGSISSFVIGIVAAIIDGSSSSKEKEVSALEQAHDGEQD